MFSAVFQGLILLSRETREEEVSGCRKPLWPPSVDQADQRPEPIGFRNLLN